MGAGCVTKNTSISLGDGAAPVRLAANGLTDPLGSETVPVMKHGSCTLAACAGLASTLACGPGPDLDPASTGDTGDSSDTSGATSTEHEPSTGSPTHSHTTGDTTAASSDSTDASSSTTDPATTGPSPVCGDGVIEGDEECDDPGETSCTKCVRDRLVFVTSNSMFPGNFGDEAADIDFDCNQLAAFAGLVISNERRFKTWISTSHESAADRIYHSPGRYVLRNGLVFAESWDAMIAGQILNPLNVDENSQTQHVIVWTDTLPDGSTMPGDHCADWTSYDWESWAYWGDSDAMDINWTLYVGEASNPTVCLDAASLYCFESP